METLSFGIILYSKRTLLSTMVEEGDSKDEV